MTYRTQERSDLQPDYWDVKSWHEAVLRKVMGQMMAALNVIPIEEIFDGTFFEGGDEDD
jgi:hypothetical protein